MARRKSTRVQSEEEEGRAVNEVSATHTRALRVSDREIEHADRLFRLRQSSWRSVMQAALSPRKRSTRRFALRAM
jgi:hypothetical protein